MEEQKITRRSPNFPSHTLQRAIELAERVYNRAFTSAIETSIFLELMGFKGVSGASRTAMSTLKQYGLVEGRDDNNKITPLAEQIIHPIGDLEKYSAIIESFNKPSIFKEIHEQFKGGVPEYKVLKSLLIRKYSFSDSGAETLIRTYRENEEFIRPIKDRYDALLSISGTPQSDVHNLQTNENALHPNPVVKETSEEYEFIRVKLSTETSASVSFKGPITKSTVEKLIAYLELAKDSYENT
ncbi:hypothetical protein [Agrobacterium leguminum]|jgi:hypothetical protein|uniref:hypothetical protein n=1 Tax=Agrobacterium leguminum TaxID=2792015 RepID=UPI003CE52912